MKARRKLETTKPKTKSKSFSSKKFNTNSKDDKNDRKGYSKPGTNRFKPGNPGRPKGCKNKFTNLKQAFIDAFTELGGAAGLQQWANQDDYTKKNFYQMISKMLPREFHVTPDSELSPGNLTALKDDELDKIIRSNT